MTDEAGRSRAFRRIHEEAAEWVVKKSLGFTPEERLAYKQWLAASPIHRERMSANDEVWNDAAALGELLGSGSERDFGLSESLAAPGLGARRRWRWKASFFAVAAAACLAVGFFALQFEGGGPARFEKALVAAELERVFLPDGSLLEMRAGAEAVASFDKARRHVRLLSGEAHFSVAKDLERPFVVETRTARFQAIGTAFSVLAEGEEVTLLVTEGTVRMSVAEPPLATAAVGEGEPFVQDFTANQQALLPLVEERVAPVVEAVSKAEIEEMLSWKQEILDFEATPLSRVVLEFNRRNRDQMVLGDPSLGSVKIDGSFRSDNLPAFARLVELSAGLKADWSERGKIVFYRR